MAAGLISLGWLCPDLIGRLVSEAFRMLVWTILIIALVVIIASRWWWSRSLMSASGRVARAATGAAGAVIGAATLSRRRAYRDPESVLMVRLDVGGSTDIPIAIAGVGEGVRQGDLVRAKGLRVMGVVRVVSARNLTTGRVFLNTALIPAALSLALVVAIPILALSVC